MNYYRSGRYNAKLTEAYSYDKSKKQLLNNKGNNNVKKDKDNSTK